jgi:hypothetical protein
MSMLKILTPILPLISTSAFALDPAYVGHWADGTEACRVAKEYPETFPGFRITPTGMTTYNTRCSFTQQTRDGDGWKVRLSCVLVEGGKSTDNLRWQIMPDGRLRETQQNRKTIDYVRCGAR